MQLSRSKKFKIALATNEMTVEGFAKSHGVSREFVHKVLSGAATSKRISDAIDLFIKYELLKLGIVDH